MRTVGKPIKTKYKYIEFERLNEDYYLCTNRKSRDDLGFVDYFERWKEYQFNPESDFAFTVGCLLDIADFIKQLNAEKK